MGVLDDIIVGVRQDLETRRGIRPQADVEVALASMKPALDPMPALRAPGLAVIAEVKRQSPSKGALADIPDPAQLASDYEAGGAAVVSVLTEKRRFGGSLDDLVAVRARVDIPVLRKDFIVTDYQVFEARAAGADLILLIVAALSDAELSRLAALAGSLGMACLVEAHTEDEVRRAVASGAHLIGVNNRDLQTLAVDLAQFERLAAHIPSGVVKVAESGILSLDDARRMAEAGADAVLVGELLVTGGNPQGSVADLIAVGA